MRRGRGSFIDGARRLPKWPGHVPTYPLKQAVPIAPSNGYNNDRSRYIVIYRR